MEGKQKEVGVVPVLAVVNGTSNGTANNTVGFDKGKGKAKGKAKAKATDKATWIRRVRLIRESQLHKFKENILQSLKSGESALFEICRSKVCDIVTNYVMRKYKCIELQMIPDVFDNVSAAGASAPDNGIVIIAHLAFHSQRFYYFLADDSTRTRKEVMVPCGCIIFYNKNDIKEDYETRPQSPSPAIGIMRFALRASRTPKDKKRKRE